MIADNTENDSTNLMYNEENLADEEMDEEKFQPINDIREFLNERYYTGNLALYLMAFVVVYNFLIFFSAPGYEIYYWVPIICLISSFLLRYWEPQTLMRLNAGTFFIILFGIWDSIVSLSFIETIDDWFANLALPTLLIDVIIVGYIGYWRFKIYDISNIGSYNESSADQTDEEEENYDDPK